MDITDNEDVQKAIEYEERITFAVDDISLKAEIKTKEEQNDNAKQNNTSPPPVVLDKSPTRTLYEPCETGAMINTWNTYIISAVSTSSSG